MKYLQWWKIFESDYSDREQQMMDDLSDILLDLGDLNFYTNIESDKYIINITISRLRNIKGFIRSDEELVILREVLNRIKDYGRMNEYLVDLTWIGRINNMSKEEINKIMDERRFTMYITMYPKWR